MNYLSKIPLINNFNIAKFQYEVFQKPSKKNLNILSAPPRLCVKIFHIFLGILNYYVPSFPTPTNQIL